MAMQLDFKRWFWKEYFLDYSLAPEKNAPDHGGYLSNIDMENCPTFYGLVMCSMAQTSSFECDDAMSLKRRVGRFTTAWDGTRDKEERAD